MPRINVLPQQIAELIAAGEVVERPASVVKELLENAIDAGATSITAEIRGGGIHYIRITDNGCGIEKDDVQKAFLPHATSKVKTAEDLDRVLTLGFRGEALSSIAAVSRVEVLTRTKEDDSGTAYAIAGGEELKNESAGCPLGTTIVVRDLFYNTPARMKFLKRDISEANAVADVVDRLALSHPEISFRFLREGKQTLLTPGDGKLMSAIYAVFGKTFADGLVEVHYTLDHVQIDGYICRPISARPSRTMQFFFLNGRWIKSRSMSAAMENAYKNAIMVGRFPSCVLNVSVPTHLVDVNVHPTKTEVRFSDDRKITSCLYYAVRSALQSDDEKKQVDLARLTQKPKPAAVQLQMVEDETDASEPIVSVPKGNLPQRRDDFWSKMPASDYRSVKKTQLSSPKADNPFLYKESDDLLASFDRRNELKAKAKADAPVSEKRQNEPAGDLPDVLMEKAKKPQVLPKNVQITEQPQPPKLRLIGEAFRTYIICEFDGKLCLIDKHAAHERVIFNRLKAQSGEKGKQVLLSPVTLLVSKAEYAAILENLDAFAACGFTLEDFGSDTVVVRECPMMIDPADVQDLVLEITENLMQSKSDVQSERIDRMIATTACKAAIKAGNRNDSAELLALAERVLYHEDVRFCPHGRPVVIEMSRYELEKQFGRIQ
ncbi:MAG: DNA mismatch repair endonuclease MutL [Clostridia bacterium]|nr:DNA mismatch repair endonuclease MutL [Clostridia bacterium]